MPSSCSLVAGSKELSWRVRALSSRVETSVVLYASFFCGWGGDDGCPKEGMVGIGDLGVMLELSVVLRRSRQPPVAL